VSKGFTHSLLRHEGFTREVGSGSTSYGWFASTIGLDLRVSSGFGFSLCSCTLPELLVLLAPISTSVLISVS
jgi:hypothetical protein